MRWLQGQLWVCSCVEKETTRSSYADGFEDRLLEFPERIAQCEANLQTDRRTLFPLRQSGELDTGTHTDVEELYSKIIEAFDTALVKPNKYRSVSSLRRGSSKRSHRYLCVREHQWRGDQVIKAWEHGTETST